MPVPFHMKTVQSEGNSDGHSWLTIHTDNFSQPADYYGGRKRAELTVTTYSNCAGSTSEICDSAVSDIFVRESSTDVAEFSTSVTTVSTRVT